MPLSREQCLGLLLLTHVGRLCVIVDGTPMAFPVNYRLAADISGMPLIIVRTRAGSVLDVPLQRVGFEIDGIDDDRQTGWSVIVQGSLAHADNPLTATDAAPLLDPRPWPTDDTHDVWLMLSVEVITGRELVGTPIEWAFHIEGYL
jgi:nitroimidazol reductase NimA-like FMN-containing flavoprotein (pyridoxamine 5'-phosphate oxidase superfamily)